jgi:hypothetical protein
MDTNANNKNLQVLISGSTRARRLGLIAAGVGLGSAVAYLLAKVLGGNGYRPAPRLAGEHIVDDRGTGQERAALLLRNLRDRAFEANDEKLALALGRPLTEVVGWNEGRELIDDDVVMKARGIALIRGVPVE